ncbi:MAG: prepilin peptidase [Acidobacteria bacterium]|nr:prepilin peptidase [Acidobacteriota bacterium]
MTALGYVGLALLGLVVGSFLTMVIDRVPDRLSVLRPGPRCPYCEHGLGGSELVPLVGFMVVRGRCRYCDHHITPAYPAVELITAAAFVVAAWRIGAHPQLVPVLIFFATLIALSVVDLYRYRIPDRILFPGMLAGIIGITVVSVIEDEPRMILAALTGALIYFFLLLVPHLIYPKGMGFGDVKLALLLGLFLGWVDSDVLGTLQLILYALLIGALVASVGGTILFLFRKVSHRTILPDPEADESEPLSMLGSTLPFGPALALSAGLVFLFSQQLLGT